MAAPLYTLAINTVAPTISERFREPLCWLPIERTKPCEETPMAKLTNKTALVTGGSRGIGAAIARRLTADGASVAITYTKGAEAAQSVVKGIEKAGGKAIAIQADATDAAAVIAAVEKTVATFGRLDVLVNNAGTAIPKPFEEAPLEEIDRMIDINVRGVFIATQAALKHLKDGGRIINIGSCVGERMMTPGLVAYAATKGAVKMFTQGLARELGGRAITVNNIQPGPIDTELNPAASEWATPQIANTALNRYGSVDDVAALVSFVAGPESSYITGANLTVDGGTNA
jgi:3-oxoacyl-[acyl-carrier protein] reductase